MPNSVQVLISFEIAYAYMLDELYKINDRSDMEETAHALLNIIIKGLFNFNADWSVPDEHDKVIEVLISCGADRDKAIDIARVFEGYVVAIMDMHLPKFRSDEYFGQATMRFYNESSIVVTIYCAALQTS